MTDVLLTHSYHLPYDAKQLRKMQPYAPIGTLYAATALRERGITVAIFDAMLEPPGDKFLALVKDLRPKLVVVYEDDFNFLSKMCLTRMREVAAEILRAARTIGAITIIHGSDSTDNPELFLRSGFDYVLCGEAENVLVQLCSSIIEHAELPELDGLVRIDEFGKITYSQQRLAKNQSWTELAPPSRDLIDLEPYRRAWTDAHGYFSTNMVASRGCPFHCNWCAKPISANRFQLRTASAVAKEMLNLKERGVQHVWFGDDVFALNRHWVKEFAEEVAQRSASIPFKIQSRADLMHEETVLHLKAAGCAEVWLGVESGAQSILDSMDKGILISNIVAARARLKEADIRACFFLQFGYPGETWTELQQTIELVRRLRPDEIGISFSYPLPGTVFYERVQAQLGTKRNWTDSDDLCIMFKAAYTTDFYRAVREALHAEVDSWQQPQKAAQAGLLWEAVHALEPVSRIPDAFELTAFNNPDPTLVTVEQLTAPRTF